ncbi:MAG: hypothetical protein HXL95_01825 [[Eubacterium] sulci]|nr:hypothetical protein [[Eubacterium] sulci]
MRIGISGASGKIGSYTCKYLSRFMPDVEIIGGTRNKSQFIKELENQNSHFSWRQLDLNVDKSIFDFIDEIDMFVNVSGAQNLSRSIRKIILDKMPLIEVGHESYFDTLNREETRNPFLYGVGMAPGFTGLLSIAMIDCLEKKKENVKARKLWYLVRESISRSAAEDMADLFASKVTTNQTASIENNAVSLPLFSNIVYPFQYYDAEATAVDEIYNINSSETYMLREDGDLYNIAARYAGDKNGLTNYFIKASEATAADSQFVRMAAEVISDHSSMTIVLEGPSQSALSGCTCAATITNLIKNGCKARIERLAECSNWKEIYEQVISSGIFYVNETYNQSMFDLGNEESGEI